MQTKGNFSKRKQGLPGCSFLVTMSSRLTGIFTLFHSNEGRWGTGTSRFNFPRSLYPSFSSLPRARSGSYVVLRLSSSNCSPDHSTVVFQRQPPLLRIVFDFSHGSSASVSLRRYCITGRCSIVGSEKRVDRF